MNNKEEISLLNVKIKGQNSLPTYVNAFVATHNAVRENRRKKQPLLTALQKEVLYSYAQEPTEKQWKQLDIFLFYLLNEGYYNAKSPQEIDAYNALPKQKLAIKREALTPFQNKLLGIYDHSLTELQTQKLKDFLFKLFNNLLNQFDAKKQEEIMP